MFVCVYRWSQEFMLMLMLMLWCNKSLMCVKRVCGPAISS